MRPRPKLQDYRPYHATWAEIFELLESIQAQLECAAFKPEIILAPKSGAWIPAKILQDKLGECDVVSCSILNTWGNPLIAIIEGIKGSRVLVLDDIIDTGKTIRLILSQLVEYGPAEMLTATLYWKKRSNYHPTWNGKEVPGKEWVVFPWEYEAERRWMHG